MPPHVVQWHGDPIAEAVLKSTLSLIARATLPAAVLRSAEVHSACRDVSTLLAMASSSDVMERFIAERFFGISAGVGLLLVLAGFAAVLGDGFQGSSAAPSCCVEAPAFICVAGLDASDQAVHSAGQWMATRTHRAV
jgi:hypothetical protein